jgi:calcium-activated chloride channel regulator 3/4
MRKSYRNGLLFRKPFLLCLILFMVLIFAGYADAGSSPLTKHDYDDESKIGYFDLVVSLNWIPTQEEKDGRLKNAFEQFAKDTFMMTEGKQKIRKLYVFSNKEQMNFADIQLLNEGGRSNANPGGIFNSGGRILTYTSFSSGTSRSDQYIGHTIAHEFGHYAYALFDEYAEAGRKSSKWPAQPLENDTPRDTIMNSQGLYQWFSMGVDYPEDGRKTAQWRYYQASAWDTLVNNPKDDKRPLYYRTGYDRIRYQPFAAMDYCPVVLTKPTDGWDTAPFDILWMEGNIVVLVIDKSGSMGNYGSAPMQAAINAANQFVDLMNFGERVAVVPFESSASVLVPLRLLETQADKDAVKNAINTLTANDGTSFSAALNTTQTVLSPVELENTNRIVLFMSDGIAGAPDTSWYQQNSISIYTIGLGDGVEPSVLQSIASSTGGQYLASPSNEELANVYARIRSGTAGSAAEVANNEAELTLGSEINFVTTLSSEDGATRFRASWSAGNILFKLTTPNGTEITPDTLPAGVTFTSGTNYAIYEVDAPISGDWISTLSLSDAAQTNIVHQVTSQSTLSVGVTLTGGSYPEPIGVVAAVNGPEVVINATVVATVTLPSEHQEIITLLDNGLPPDQMANDGIYSGVLADYSENGIYNFEVVVSNPDGLAGLDNSGALESGDNPPPVPLSPFSRYSSDSLTVSDVRNLPSDPSNAEVITPDNTPANGAITVPGAEVWYQFDAIQGTEYFIQTTSLLSWDPKPMATNVKLYDMDQTTEIYSSEFYDGTNASFISWLAPQSGRYFIKVTHTDTGTGVYVLTVGTTSVFSKAFDDLSSKLSLPSGWNLISLCKQPSDTSIDSVLKDIEGKYLSVWAFQNSSWKVYDPDQPGFSDLSTMEAGWGYWINMMQAGTLTVTGTEPSESIDLIRGWNLVGYNSCTPQSIVDALASIDGKYISVWAYINGQWRVYDPANPGFSDLTTMEPGYGYWIKTKQNCTWTLP